MTDENMSNIIDNINKLHHFFELWNVIKPFNPVGETTRTYTISSKPSSAWLGIDVITVCDGQGTSLHIGIKKNYRKLTLEGNTREPRYVLEIPKHPQEEDKEVRDMLFAIHGSVKHHLSVEAPSVEIIDTFYNY